MPSLCKTIPMMKEAREQQQGQPESMPTILGTQETQGQTRTRKLGA